MESSAPDDGVLGSCTEFHGEYFDDENGLSGYVDQTWWVTSPSYFSITFPSPGVAQTTATQGTQLARQSKKKTESRLTNALFCLIILIILDIYI